MTRTVGDYLAHTKNRISGPLETENKWHIIIGE
jgi:hypothetical protein